MSNNFRNVDEIPSRNNGRIDRNRTSNRHDSGNFPSFSNNLDDVDRTFRRDFRWPNDIAHDNANANRRADFNPNKPEVNNAARDFDANRTPPQGINDITNVDLSVKTNTDLHRTSKYDIVRREEVLVVRRGQSFTIQISFKENFDPKLHEIKFVFDLGPSANVINGTKQVIEVEDETLPVKHWGCRKKAIQGNRVWVECLAAPNTAIGMWRLSIVSASVADATNFDRREIVFKIKKPIFILFNPWCKADSVFFDDDEWRKECVMRDVGKIWMGTSKDIHSRMWSYGQYEENVLSCAFLALDMTKMPQQRRNNPIEVCRAISAIVNSLDDRGILEGNWSGSYKKGVNPTDWQGSTQIMQKYYKTRNSVKYGQCWVFAGVTTTILRALGIPCRTITNFNSAHDTNLNLSVDEIYNEKMEIREEISTDSIWNFHVWNECWMTRPDLPSGYGGWQLLDSTPQEKSENIHRCGPVSIKAIRNGNVGLQYDTGFAFAEVNADVVSWILKGRNNRKPIFLNRDEHRIGQSISCTKPNSISNMDDDRHDITNDYKPEEKTGENKASVLNALNVSKSPTLLSYGSSDKDVEFTLVDLVNVNLGENLAIILKMLNLTNSQRTLTISLHLYSIYYTGRDIKMEIPAEDYLDLVKDGCNFHVTCMAIVSETNQVFSSVDDFIISMPTINIKVENLPLKLNKQSSIKASFVNPLKKTLRNSKWILEGPGINKPKVIASRDIPGSSLAMLEANITPRDTGNKTILVSFSSSDLNDIEGYLHVSVIQ
ncbi:unnamed protein product [Gordionus sp. m RMFG-2023]